MEEHTSGLTLRGKLFKEEPEAVTLKVGNSLFEIPRSYVLSRREVEETGEDKVVEVKIAANAHMIQRVLSSAWTLMTTRLPILAAACDCACNCNCACECACGGGGSKERFAESSSFRSRVSEDAAAQRAA